MADAKETLSVAKTVLASENSIDLKKDINGVTIAWESNNVAINVANGAVTHGENDVTVKLTATLSIKDASNKIHTDKTDKKFFDVKVIGTNTVLTPEQVLSTFADELVATAPVYNTANANALINNITLDSQKKIDDKNTVNIVWENLSTTNKNVAFEGNKLTLKQDFVEYTAKLKATLTLADATTVSNAAAAVAPVTKEISIKVPAITQYENTNCTLKVTYSEQKNEMEIVENSGNGKLYTFVIDQSNLKLTETGTKPAGSTEWNTKAKLIESIEKQAAELTKLENNKSTEGLKACMDTFYVGMPQEHINKIYNDLLTKNNNNAVKASDAFILDMKTKMLYGSDVSDPSQLSIAQVKEKAIAKTNANVIKFDVAYAVDKDGILTLKKDDKDILTSGLNVSTSQNSGNQSGESGAGSETVPPAPEKK